MKTKLTFMLMPCLIGISVLSLFSIDYGQCLSVCYITHRLSSVIHVLYLKSLMSWPSHRPLNNIKSHKMSWLLHHKQWLGFHACLRHAMCHRFHIIHFFPFTSVTASNKSSPLTFGSRKRLLYFFIDFLLEILICCGVASRPLLWNIVI